MTHRHRYVPTAYAETEMCTNYGPPRCGMPLRKPALAVEHSQPSKDAAIHAESTRNRTQTLVWNALAANPDGSTTEEVCEETGLDGSTVRPRLVELDEEGRAERMTVNGKPWHPVTNPDVLMRKNAAGHSMTLWKIVR